MNTNNELETATLGGGCFWCLEPIFSELQGVSSVVVGYAGGTLVNPGYQMVCTGATGHAEVVQISFDPTIISYREILEVFFSFHDPTTLNRQGADYGTQYRSIILTHNPQQEQTAQQTLIDLTQAKVWDTPIVTQIVPLEHFYPAEEYHQHYFIKNPFAGYCQVVIQPKVQKLKQHYAAMLKMPS